MSYASERKEALYHMRKAIVILAFSILVWGCNKHEEPPPGFHHDAVQTLSAEEFRDAPQSVVIGNTTLRLEVFALEDHMPIGVSPDPKTGLIPPDPRKMGLSFRLVSQNGTPLPSKIRPLDLWLSQNSKLWSTNAIGETVGAANGLSRDFAVYDGPTGQSMTPIDVVISLEEKAGNVYLLAIRQQRINVVN
jgi:hypothetical protein